MEETKSKKQLSISRHQLALIAVIFLVLGIITWFRSSERIIQNLTQIFSKQENKVHVSIKDRPEYKKYFEPKQDVLGVTTDIEEKPGTMIIGEDGKMHSVEEDIGKVLGASTETIDTNLQNIQVKLAYTNTIEDVKKYLNTTLKLEGEVLDGAALETALSTNDQNTINQLVSRVEALEARLQDMWIPESVTKLHKLKILEFRSVARLLKSYPNLEANPYQATFSSRKLSNCP
jgi:hypothetical protein